MATLPSRRPGRGRARAGSRTGVAGDVSQVQRTPDPGIRVPARVFDESSTAVGQSLQQLGAVIAQKDKGEQEQINKNQFNSSMLDFLKVKSEMEGSFSSDPIHRTLTERTSTQLNEAIDILSQSFTDPGTRDAFVTASTKQAIETVAKARATTKLKETDLSLSNGERHQENVLGIFIKNPNLPLKGFQAGVVSIEDYYNGLAADGTISRVQAETINDSFRTKAAQVKFQQASEFLVENGGPNEFKALVKNLRAGAFRFPPEDVEREINTLTVNYNQVRTKINKAEKAEVKLDQDTRFSELSFLLPGVNTSDNPDLTQNRIKIALTDRTITPSAARTLFDDLAKSQRDLTDAEVTKFEEDLFKFEKSVASRTGAVLRIEGDLILLGTANPNQLDEDVQARYTDLLAGARLWKEDEKNRDGKERTRQIKQVSDVIELAVDETQGLTYVTSGVKERARQKRQVLNLQVIAAARIRNGEDFWKVQNDMISKIQGVVFKFDQEDLDKSENIIAHPSKFTEVEKDVARARWFLNTAQKAEVIESKKRREIAQKEIKASRDKRGRK